MSDKFPHAVRCQTSGPSGSPCNSAIFYDWGIEFMTAPPVTSVTGNSKATLSEWAAGDRVKICAVCNTPYILDDGKLLDISDELPQENVKQIISRGQATLPHPKVKDP